MRTHPHIDVYPVGLFFKLVFEFKPKPLEHHAHAFLHHLSYHEQYYSVKRCGLWSALTVTRKIHTAAVRLPYSSLTIGSTFRTLVVKAPTLCTSACVQRAPPVARGEPTGAASIITGCTGAGDSKKRRQCHTLSSDYCSSNKENIDPRTGGLVASTRPRPGDDVPPARKKRQPRRLRETRQPLKLLWTSEGNGSDTHNPIINSNNCCVGGDRRLRAMR